MIMQQIKHKVEVVGVLPSWVMCDRSVMILEGFFLLLGGAGFTDRGMIPDWENRDQSRFNYIVKCLLSFCSSLE